MGRCWFARALFVLAFDINAQGSSVVREREGCSTATLRGGHAYYQQNGDIWTTSLAQGGIVLGRQDFRKAKTEVSMQATDHTSPQSWKPCIHGGWMQGVPQLPLAPAWWPCMPQTIGTTSRARSRRTPNFQNRTGQAFVR